MIILLGKDEPLLCDSRAEALETTEWVDIVDGEYQPFDERGRRLRFEIEYPPGPNDPTWPKVPDITISVRQDEPDSPEAQKDREYLVVWLRKFVSAQGSMTVEPSASLATLLKCCEKLGY